jgi:hypothetical protein
LELHPHWWISTFGIGDFDNYIMKDIILYHRTYEQKMENYYKLALVDPTLTQQYSSNRYYNGFLGAPNQPVDQVLKREQSRIMIRQWGGRSPIDGRVIKTDTLGIQSNQLQPIIMNMLPLTLLIIMIAG